VDFNNKLRVQNLRHDSKNSNFHSYVFDAGEIYEGLVTASVSPVLAILSSIFSISLLLRL